MSEETVADFPIVPDERVLDVKGDLIEVGDVVIFSHGRGQRLQTWKIKVDATYFDKKIMLGIIEGERVDNNDPIKIVDARFTTIFKKHA